MSRKILLTLGIGAALLLSQRVQASDIVYPGGGVLAQVVDGGGSSTTITLVNMDNLQAPYTLKFFGDDGNPLTVSTTAGPPATQLTGTLNSGASVIIKTNGGGAATVEGWALVTTPVTTDAQNYYHNTIAGTAVFSLVLPGNPVSDAAVALDTGFDSIFALPFDHTTAVVGMALANPNQTTTMTVNLKFYDLSGNVLFTDSSVQLPGNGHTSFLLTDKFPQLAGQKGLVVITGSTTDPSNTAGYLNVLGLRANLRGTSLSTVTPIVPCNYLTGYGCTN